MPSCCTAGGVSCGGGGVDHDTTTTARRCSSNRGVAQRWSQGLGWVAADGWSCSPMDKATILYDAVSYVKEQQEKLKKAEGRNNARSIDSVVLLKRPMPDGAAATTTSSLPEIEAKISESNVMVRIHCDDGKGVLVRLLAQVEGLHLSITHTNVTPCFPACTLNITIMAKVDEGFSIAPEDIVEKLAAALHGHI